LCSILAVEDKAKVRRSISVYKKERRTGFSMWLLIWLSLSLDVSEVFLRQFPITLKTFFYLWRLLGNQLELLIPDIFYNIDCAVLPYMKNEGKLRSDRLSHIHPTNSTNLLLSFYRFFKTRNWKHCSFTNPNPIFPRHLTALATSVLNVNIIHTVCLPNLLWILIRNRLHQCRLSIVLWLSACE
jgi:hypothetical protein